MFKKIYTGIINYFNKKSEKEFMDAQLLRMVQIEYKKDWQYVYYMFSNGKKPYSD